MIVSWRKFRLENLGRKFRKFHNLKINTVKNCIYGQTENPFFDVRHV